MTGVRSQTIELTSISRQMRTTIAMAAKLHKACVVTGPSGIGKSTTGTAIAAEDAFTVYLKAGPRNKRLTVFFNYLADVLSALYGGVYLPAKASQQARFDAIVQHLRFHGVYLIMIDEAQNLDWDTMREVMDLGEEAGIAICFIGNSTVLKRTKATADAINQLRSRVSGRTLELSRFSADDVAMIASTRNVEGGDAVRMLQSFTMLSPENDLRAVDAVIDTAREFAGDGFPIRLAHLRRAFKLGFPKQDERDLFKVIPKPKREENAA